MRLWVLALAGMFAAGCAAQAAERTARGTRCTT